MKDIETIKKENTEAVSPDMERPLPVGMTEFETFANRIIAQAGRFADEDSMKFALATSIIHADASKGSLPDSFFINRLRKAAANQVASQVFQDIKNKQQAAMQAEQEKQAKQAALEAEELANLRVAESTPPKVDTANVKEEI